MKRLILLITILFVFHTISFSQSAEEIVKSFLTNVRSGLRPNDARLYMADTVLAHQVNAENPVTVKRTPDNYTAHVKEFLRLFGNYSFEITELIASKDKVYVRWKQTGIHKEEIDGYAPTQLPIIEFTSAVYRVKNKRIVEYWIQMDRLGFELQLKANAESLKK